MELFRIAQPQWLYALLIIPVLTIFFVIARIMRKKALSRFSQSEMLAILMPNASNSRPVLKFIILMIALASIIFGLARPQFGSKLKTEKREGVELVIALDVSNSMMAEDIQPNRLERAKRAIAQLVDRLSDDKIGLIVFAGQAYTQLPITTDYPSAKLFLESVSTEIVPTQGTAIGAAIELGMRSFSPQFEGSKAMIIITDGENHEDDAIGAATAAAENGVVVHTIGMGLPQGGPIPVFRNGQKDYRTDKEGNVVVTKLDEPMLQQIAAAGKGIYVRANNAQIGLSTLFNEINKMETSEMESRVYSDYNDQFQYFIALGLFLIFIEFMILERKNKYLKNFKLFGK
ncbi:MAG: VWA domain-containing protein [Prolixibacteraceae bacterium]|jgi:Ca-activated chloride channel family protein|nr:VWA domain-containing protein [Prolixibacteraceae bacterium]